MAVYFSAIASGSNGNCYYVGTDHEAVLVDAGVSCKEIETRMKRLQLSIQKVKAVFVSHEHTDHIRGLASLTKKYRVPVYITTPTLRNGRLFLEKSLITNFSGYQPVQIGALQVTAFPKLHDAADPFSFIISSGGINVGVFTDIGLPCEHVIRHFSQCHAAFLEANYDEDMLANGGYPYYLKKRISGERGHLSNRQALELFRRHRSPQLSHLFLAHLSQNNNCPVLVKETFTAHAADVELIVASRHEETPLYCLRPATAFAIPARVEVPEQLQFAF